MHTEESRGSPVVVCIIPVVKMNQEAIVHHVSDGCYTDEGGIHAVHCLQLHSYLKATLYIELHKK